MFKEKSDKRIEYLIDISKSDYMKIPHKEFIELYEEIIEILNSEQYSENQKKKLKEEAFLESMSITYDWLKNYN